MGLVRVDAILGDEQWLVRAPLVRVRVGVGVWVRVRVRVWGRVSRACADAEVVAL